MLSGRVSPPRTLYSKPRVRCCVKVGPSLFEAPKSHWARVGVRAGGLGTHHCRSLGPFSGSLPRLLGLWGGGWFDTSIIRALKEKLLAGTLHTTPPLPEASVSLEVGAPLAGPLQRPSYRSCLPSAQTLRPPLPTAGLTQEMSSFQPFAGKTPRSTATSGTPAAWGSGSISVVRNVTRMTAHQPGAGEGCWAWAVARRAFPFLVLGLCSLWSHGPPVTALRLSWEAKQEHSLQATREVKPLSSCTDLHQPALESCAQEVFAKLLEGGDHASCTFVSREPCPAPGRGQTLRSGFSMKKQVGGSQACRAPVIHV